MPFTLDQLGGGSLHQTNDATHVVTLWMVPGGWDYHGAVPVNVFFTDGEIAQQFTQLHTQPPALASLDVITHEALVGQRYQRLFGDK